MFLIPRSIPTRWVPLVLLLMYSIWFGVHLHVLIGFGVGYVLCYAPFPASATHGAQVVRSGAHQETGGTDWGSRVHISGSSGQDCSRTDTMCRRMTSHSISRQLPPIRLK